MEDPLLAAANGPTSKMKSKVVLERAVVTTADGRIFDLGRPSHPMFRLRVLLYKWQRRYEIRAAEGDSNG